MTDKEDPNKPGKIATGAQCKKHFETYGGLDEAHDRVDTSPEERHTFNAINVAFSGKGTTKLVGPYDELKLRDLLHERGMYQDMVFEGPDEPESLADEYKPPKNWPANNDNWRCDGMFIVAAQREDELETTIKELKSNFGITGNPQVDKDQASAEITLEKRGHVRNADGKAQRRGQENLRGKEQ